MLNTSTGRAARGCFMWLGGPSIKISQYGHVHTKLPVDGAKLQNIY